MHYNISKLKNGMNIIVVWSDHWKSVVIRVYVRIGSRFENKKDNGLSHLVEHILFKKIFNISKIKSKIIDNPITQNFTAVTLEDLTIYSFKIHKKDANQCIDLLSRILTSSDFSSVDVPTEKQIIFEEIRNEKDEFLFKFDKKFRETYYNNNQLANSILGTKKNVGSFSIKEIKTFFNYYYNPKNIVLVVAGNVDKNQITKIINNKFNFKIDEIKRSKIKNFKLPNEKINFIFKSSRQLYFNLVYSVFIKNNKQRIKWEVLRFALGNYLYNTIRNKGFCYSFDVIIEEFEEFFNLRISADISKNKILEFYKELKLSLKNFYAEFNSQDLNLVKESIIKNYEIDIDDPFIVARNIGWQASIFGPQKVLLFDKLQAVIKKTTLGDIRNFYKQLFKKRGNLFILGNLDRKIKKGIKKAYFLTPTLAKLYPLPFEKSEGVDRC